MKAMCAVQVFILRAPDVIHAMLGFQGPAIANTPSVEPQLLLLCTARGVLYTGLDPCLQVLDSTYLILARKPNSPRPLALSQSAFRNRSTCYSKPRAGVAHFKSRD